MIDSILGWTAFVAALALPCACVQEIVLHLGGLRVPPAARGAIVCAGAVGLWFLIPFAVHATLGRAPH